jgi:hypothetical protein
LVGVALAGVASRPPPSPACIAQRTPDPRLTTVSDVLCSGINFLSRPSFWTRIPTSSVPAERRADRGGDPAMPGSGACQGKSWLHVAALAFLLCMRTASPQAPEGGDPSILVKFSDPVYECAETAAIAVEWETLFLDPAQVRVPTRALHPPPVCPTPRLSDPRRSRAGSPVRTRSQHRRAFSASAPPPAQASEYTITLELLHPPAGWSTPALEACRDDELDALPALSVADYPPGQAQLLDARAEVPFGHVQLARIPAGRCAPARLPWGGGPTHVARRTAGELQTRLRRLRAGTACARACCARARQSLSRRRAQKCAPLAGAAHACAARSPPRPARTRLAPPAPLPRKYGGKDETCPLSTGERTRRVQLVRGEGGGQRGSPLQPRSLRPRAPPASCSPPAPRRARPARIRRARRIRA